MPLRIRPREAADVDVLADVLAAQRPVSNYPFILDPDRTMQDFLVRRNELAAWVATYDGRTVGHVSVTTAPPTSADLTRAWRVAHGCSDAQLAVVSALFASVDARGLGVGKALLRSAVDFINSLGRRPCLDTIYPAHAASVGLYQSAGWLPCALPLSPDWIPAPAVQIAMVRPAGEVDGLGAMFTRLAAASDIPLHHVDPSALARRQAVMMASDGRVLVAATSSGTYTWWLPSRAADVSTPVDALISRHAVGAAGSDAIDDELWQIWALSPGADATFDDESKCVDAQWLTIADVHQAIDAGRLSAPHVWPRVLQDVHRWGAPQAPFLTFHAGPS